MQHVLRRSRGLDPEAARWFEVIDRFDSEVASGASVEKLVRLAAEMTNRPAAVRDEWHGMSVGVENGALVGMEALSGDEVSREVFGTRGRDRSAVRIQLSGSSALAASVEVGSGRVGVAWTLGTRRARWRPLDYLVVERLAYAVGATVLARRDRTANASSRARAAVEKLLAGGYEEHELAEAARTAKLALDGSYVAVAVEQFPPNAMSLEALASTVARALAGRGGDARSGVVGRLVGVIVPRSAAQPTVLAAAQRSLPGVELRLGIGDTANLGELRRSWKHAQESLALGSLVNGVEPGVVFFDDLGVLHLLAQIPTSEVVASRLFHVLNDSLTHRGTPSDADVLEAYLEEGTLRRAAARVFLHHTTVEHRLKRIELQLGLDLGQPPARFQAQLLLKLHRIVRLQDAART